MLVLTRRIGEEIVIGGDTRVTILAINGKQVRLGITAPASVRVVRLELLVESPAGAALPSAARSRPALPRLRHEPRAAKSRDIDQLEKQVKSRLNGSVRHFRLSVRDGGLILQGHTSTSYAKQMAEYEVMEAVDLPIQANDIEVM